MPVSEILVCFDTEDFTSSRSADAIRDTARLLREEGVRANYNLVGLLARQLIAWDRRDVLDELMNHEIQFHSRGHSYHPTVAEYTDIPDYEAAMTRFLIEESEGMGMVKAVTGRDRLYAAVPAGANVTYVALYGYAKLGIRAYLDDLLLCTAKGENRWFCNQLYLEYVTPLESHFFRDDYDEDAFIARLARRRRSIIYNHPNIILHPDFWDALNYDGENRHPWGEWEEAPEYPADLVERFYERFRSLIRRLKSETNPDGSPRFVFRTVSEVLEEETVSRTVTRGDMALYRDALNKTFASGKPDPFALSRTCAPHISWSDCLYAVSRMLAGEESVCLDDFFSYGFLEVPQGVETRVELTEADVTAALSTIDFSTFLPASVTVGQDSVGPADLLLAALELLCEGKQVCTVEPKQQQPDLDYVFQIRDLDLKDAWLFTPDFEDRWLSDRMRLQCWTLRE